MNRYFISIPYSIEALPATLVEFRSTSYKRLYLMWHEDLTSKSIAYQHWTNQLRSSSHQYLRNVGLLGILRALRVRGSSLLLIIKTLTMTPNFDLIKCASHWKLTSARTIRFCFFAYYGDWARTRGREGRWIASSELKGTKSLTFDWSHREALLPTSKEYDSVSSRLISKRIAS